MFSFYLIIPQTGKKSIDAQNFFGRISRPPGAREMKPAPHRKQWAIPPRRGGCGGAKKELLFLQRSSWSVSCSAGRYVFFGLTLSRKEQSFRKPDSFFAVRWVFLTCTWEFPPRNSKSRVGKIGTEYWVFPAAAAVPKPVSFLNHRKCPPEEVSSAESRIPFSILFPKSFLFRTYQGRRN